MAIGGYAHQEERDTQLTHTFGSQQWLWSEEDDFRFHDSERSAPSGPSDPSKPSKPSAPSAPSEPPAPPDPSDRRLESLYLLIPDEPCTVPEEACAGWIRTTVVAGGLRAEVKKGFALETTTTRWLAPEARHMICLREQAPHTPSPEEGGMRLRIAPDTDLLLADGKMAGWMLTNPARYLVKGWDRPADTPPAPGTSLLLAAYLAMTSWPAFEKILDGDGAACRELRALEERIRHQTGDPSRTAVLAHAVALLIEDHC
ncbi:hypothetical protein AB0D04_29175 [Streptomyces sp. NPDC048483]|uniref:hypothetical protein n=1 Tax=Streptomyces sp. NPDC048483 TaxID=3154927 RepID=UPI00343E5527